MALIIAIIIAFFSSSLAEIQFVKLVEANFIPMQIPQPAFIIKTDESIYPPTAPIVQDGNTSSFSDDTSEFTIASES